MTTENIISTFLSKDRDATLDALKERLYRRVEDLQRIIGKEPRDNFNRGGDTARSREIAFLLDTLDIIERS